MLVYINDILCRNDDLESALAKLDTYFPLKLDSVGESDVYLGAELKLTQLENVGWAWGLGLFK